MFESLHGCVKVIECVSRSRSSLPPVPSLTLPLAPSPSLSQIVYANSASSSLNKFLARYFGEATGTLGAT